MRRTKKWVIHWISISGIVLGSTLLVHTREAYCMFGEDIPFLIQIIAQAIAQVKELQAIIGSAQETVNVLEEMNRGVKVVLRLANTAHIPLPAQVWDNARQIDAAAKAASSVYGGLSSQTPGFARTEYRSGVEGLFLSEDAFLYSSALDDQGQRVKDAAVVANQATATRLTAETLGVVLHALSHQSRIQAKALELASTRRIEDAAKEDSRFQSFTETHKAIEKDLKTSEFSPLNSFGSEP